ncbi:MAG: ATP-binding protein, partial [Victivallaceae bacterium]
MLERKRAQEQLMDALRMAQAADKAKSFFIASMSHEIRTPLNAVIGFSDFLSKGRLTAGEMNEYTSGIAHASKALLQLINDILDLSKIESNTENFADGSCNLVDLLNELQAIFIHKAREKGLVLEMIKPEALPVLRIREQSMRQILLNIVGNAMKFTLKGFVRCRIEFEQLPDSSDICLDIFIEDSGVGISPEYCKTIFDPFVQQQSVRGAKVFEGTGLGLPIAKRLTEKMGGVLSLQSRVGVGSSFHIHFDRIGSLDMPTVEKKNEELALVHEGLERNLKVLVVDDIKINLRVIGGYLKQLNVEALFAASGAEALQILRNTPDINVVMTDMWMPDLNGAELAAIIHSDSRYAKLPIIAVTADIEARANFDLSKFAGVLNKPIELNKLRIILDGLFDA